MQLYQNWPGTNQGRQSASILHHSSYKNPFIYFKDCALPFLSHLHLFLRLFLIFLSPLASRHGWIILFIITTLSQNWRAQPESEGWFRDSSPSCRCRKDLGMWTAPQLPRPLSSKGRAMREVSGCSRASGAPQGPSRERDARRPRRCQDMVCVGRERLVSRPPMRHSAYLEPVPSASLFVQANDIHY